MQTHICTEMNEEVIQAQFLKCNKTIICDLSDHLNLYLSYKSIKKIFSMSSLTNVIIFCNYKQILSLSPLKTVGTEACFIYHCVTVNYISF